MTTENAGMESFGSEIIYHFDIDRHSIPLKQFIDTAQSAQAVLDDFNNHYFDKKIKYELHVRPPENGGLIEVFDLVVIGGAGTVWAFLGTDIGKAIWRGFTDHEPAYWAEKYSRKFREYLSKKLSEKKSSENTAQEIEKYDPSEIVIENPELDAEILAELIIAFFEMDFDKLKKIGLTPALLRRAFEARNKFYRACLDNKEIKGVSFDRSHDFPIKRNDFPRQIVQIPDIEKVDIELPSAWSVEEADIIVNSPNWKRDGRKWQASTKKHQDIAFSVDDETFWHHVKIRDIQPDISDNMRVQWAYPAGQSKPSHVRVLRVLSYNGKEISKRLSEEELQEELYEVNIIEPDTPDLFDRRDDNQMGESHKNKDGN